MDIDGSLVRLPPGSIEFQVLGIISLLRALRKPSPQPSIIICEGMISLPGMFLVLFPSCPMGSYEELDIESAT